MKVKNNFKNLILKLTLYQPILNQVIIESCKMLERQMNGPSVLLKERKRNKEEEIKILKEIACRKQLIKNNEIDRRKKTKISNV